MYNCIEKYGVTLKRLTHDKIEMVRIWRNNPKISKYMEFRNEITPEMQEQWFKKINNDNNFYFIIEFEDTEIGLINIRDIDYNAGVGEPGLFIWDDNYLNSTVSFMANLNLIDFCFDTLHLKKLVSHVLTDNSRAIKFNLAFGFVKSENQEEIYNQEYSLIPSIYKIKKEKLIKYLK